MTREIKGRARHTFLANLHALIVRAGVDLAMTRLDRGGSIRRVVVLRAVPRRWGGHAALGSREHGTSPTRGRTTGTGGSAARMEHLEMILGVHQFAETEPRTTHFGRAQELEAAAKTAQCLSAGPSRLVVYNGHPRTQTLQPPHTAALALCDDTSSDTRLSLQRGAQHTQQEKTHAQLYTGRNGAIADLNKSTHICSSSGRVGDGAGELSSLPRSYADAPRRAWR